MIGRITPGYIKNDFLQNIKTNNANLQKIQNQLSSGLKVALPSDDPANVVNYMEWQSKTQDINKFNQIISTYEDKMNIIDGNLESIGSSLHRARELVVQAANGTYTKEERTMMATEMDQIVRQLVSDANSEYNGTALFAGTSAVQKPFRITESYDENIKTPFVSSVEYFGNAQDKVMDIGKNDRVTTVLPGSTIFETTSTIIQGSSDVAGYVSAQDTKILVEGVELPVLTGDNLETIAQKINDAQLSIKASIETQENGVTNFRITSISPREPWLQDIAGGTILQDLGILNVGGEAPNNYSTEAIVQKTSIFDTILSIKDSLLSDDVLALGGEDLGRMDQSLNNVLKYRTYTGAVTNRLEKTFARNESEALYLRNAAAKAVDTDYTKSITDLKMAEFAHQTALNIGAKLMPTTLMDFLR